MSHKTFVNSVPRFTSALRKTLSYEEILTNRFYLILRNFECVRSSNKTVIIIMIIKII